MFRSSRLSYSTLSSSTPSACRASAVATYGRQPSVTHQTSSAHLPTSLRTQSLPCRGHPRRCRGGSTPRWCWSVSWSSSLSASFLPSSRVPSGRSPTTLREPLPIYRSTRSTRRQTSSYFSTRQSTSYRTTSSDAGFVASSWRCSAHAVSWDDAPRDGAIAVTLRQTALCSATQRATIIETALDTSTVYRHTDTPSLDFTTVIHRLQFL